MTKEEAVARAIYDALPREKSYSLLTKIFRDTYEEQARAALAAADKWDAERVSKQAEGVTHYHAKYEGPIPYALNPMFECPECGSDLAVVPHRQGCKSGALSPSLDAELQREEDNPPASIMKEG